MGFSNEIGLEFVKIKHCPVLSHAGSLVRRPIKGVEQSYPMRESTACTAHAFVLQNARIFMQIVLFASESVLVGGKTRRK